MANNIELATFGAGCFWGTEKFFRKQFGHALTEALVGYEGGKGENPTYKQVCEGSTNHAEVCQLQYDKSKVKYADLVEYFYRFHDPTTLNQQGNDRGTQYRSVIFYHTPEQQQIAQQVTQQVQSAHYSGKTITTLIVPAGKFWTAEDYHQKYLELNPSGYCNHRLRW